ncbi:MAG TPA: response regulator [Terriglobales bacterium]|nr:response regulator [Terriglobales bacterium]
MVEHGELRGTVLLAEDEPAILYTFTTILEEAGFRVQSANTFQTAQESIRHNDYDAIITEFSLDKEGLGLELAREAKKRKRVPAVLVYTGDPTVERLRAALELGVDYFAFKPVDLDEIKTALFRLVAFRAARLRSTAS